MIPRILTSLAIVSFIGMAAAAHAGIVGDATAGKTAFAVCAACHSLKPGVAGVGPSLAGVAGKKAGTNDPKFKYSAAMKAAPAWSDARLDAFLTNPKAAVPGTVMPFAGVKDAQKRADIIAYLKAN